jgi:CheY-like chemotaxis protein
LENQPKILVVDDDDDMRAAYSRMLGKSGYEILQAADGASALGLARRERPDVVLLDVLLPDLSGVEVCRHIKADAALARTFVLNVSGHQASPDIAAEWLEAGADGYLIKPVEPRVLLAQVKAFLRIKYAETALVNQQDREIDSLGGLGSEQVTAVSSGMFGAGPISKSLPDVFEEMVERYGTLLDLALEERMYKVEHNVPEGFHVLVDRLGFLQAGPRDVVELHNLALKRKTDGATLQKVQAYVEEGRLRLIELMGHLVSYYRRRAGATRQGARKGAADRG